MSAIQQTLLGYGGGAILRPQDVFSAYPYTGNGSTQTINNGIDLAGKGGMVWLKNRSTTQLHGLVDTAIGINKYLASNSNAGVGAGDTVTAFNSNGFALGFTFNASPNNFVSWTFRKAPKFFDVVTYTGDGVNVRRISHSLGADCQFAIVKRTDTASNWKVATSDGTFERHLCLNLTDATDSTAAFANGYITMDSQRASNIALIQNTNMAAVNAVGGTYVAYLFAHDPSPEGIIQCGSFTTNGSGVGTYNHGWAEGAQYVELKCATALGDWEIFDTARTPSWSGNDARLRANLSNAEDSVARISSSGTTLTFSGLSASQTYIFTMIRAPI